MKYIQRYV